MPSKWLLRQLLLWDRQAVLINMMVLRILKTNIWTFTITQVHTLTVLSGFNAELSKYVTTMKRMISGDLPLILPKE